MIAVFVGDQHAIKAANILSYECEPAGNLFGAQSRIDENASVARNDQNRIASRAAAENGKFHQEKSAIYKERNALELPKLFKPLAVDATQFTASNNQCSAFICTHWWKNLRQL
jgi:hypothetical protein